MSPIDILIDAVGEDKVWFCKGMHPSGGGYNAHTGVVKIYDVPTNRYSVHTLVMLLHEMGHWYYKDHGVLGACPAQYTKEKRAWAWGIKTARELGILEQYHSVIIEVARLCLACYFIAMLPDSSSLLHEGIHQVDTTLDRLKLIPVEGE